MESSPLGTIFAGVAGLSGASPRAQQAALDVGTAAEGLGMGAAGARLPFTGVRMPPKVPVQSEETALRLGPGANRTAQPAVAGNAAKPVNSVNGLTTATEGTKVGKLTIGAGKFSASERAAAQHMADLGNDVVLRSPIGERSAGGTSDLLVNGIPYDVYTPVTNSPSRIIGGIAEKNSQAVGVILDLSKTSVTADDLGNILNRVQGAIKAGGKTPNITDVVVLKK